MEEARALHILKTAILLERRGQAFYSKVADQAVDSDVKEIFEIMAKEEDDHIRFLNEQFSHYVETKAFKAIDFNQEHYDESSEVLSEKLKNKISAASFEAAAIASAIDMENRAVAVYSERAKNADDPEEKKFYEFLAKWEQGHHKILYDIDQELKEKIWNDNQFWPL